MEWQDEGLVLATRRHGERDAILEVMTAGHGRHLGLVRGGRSARQAPGLQPGNRLALSWRARLEDHLGQFAAEPLVSRAGIVLGDVIALQTVMHLGALLRLLPERAPHPELYAAADGLCGLLAEPALLAPVLIRFELMILAELGFGLDLETCAATGGRDELIYVSPKSGRAVSRAAGAPWAGKLLALPAFLAGAAPADAPALADGFHLTGYFLDRHVFAPRGVPDDATRASLVAGLIARIR